MTTCKKKHSIRDKAWWYRKAFTEHREYAVKNIRLVVEGTNVPEQRIPISLMAE